MARREALLRLHQSLTARRTELRKRLGMELEDLAHTDPTAVSGDLADAAFESSGEEISSQLAELESRELSQIERALARLSSGKYGHCEICECKIPIARLNALPYSTFCINCQREAEHHGDWLDRGSSHWEHLNGSSHNEEKEVNLNQIEMDITN